MSAAVEGAERCAVMGIGECRGGGGGLICSGGVVCVCVCVCVCGGGGSTSKNHPSQHKYKSPKQFELKQS